jgi:hypothetical protein
MPVITCKAKDPAHCRFHRPNSGQAALMKLNKAQIALEAANASGSYSDRLDARYAVDQLQELYNGTPDGMAKLTEKIKNETDESAKRELERELEAAEWHVSEAEEKNAVDEAAGGPLIPYGDSDFVPPFYTGGGDELWPETTGPYYKLRLDNETVTAKVKADIRDAQKAGYLPKQVKFKMTSRRGRMKIEIQNAADEQVWEDNDSNSYSNRFTSEAEELRSRVDNIANAYSHTQYDVIEGRTNISHHTVGVQFESKFKRKYRQEKEAESKIVRLQTKADKDLRANRSNSNFLGSLKADVKAHTKDGVEISIPEGSSMILLGKGASAHIYDFNSGKSKIPTSSLVDFFAGSTEEELVKHYARSELKA